MRWQTVCARAKWCGLVAVTLHETRRPSIGSPYDAALKHPAVLQNARIKLSMWNQYIQTQSAKLEPTLPDFFQRNSRNFFFFGPNPKPSVGAKSLRTSLSGQRLYTSAYMQGEKERMKTCFRIHAYKKITNAYIRTCIYLCERTHVCIALHTCTFTH
jgi:hypothetical protein